MTVMLEILQLLAENNYSKMVAYGIEKGIIEKNGYDEYLAPSMVMQRLAKYALGAD